MVKLMEKYASMKVYPATRKKKKKKSPRMTRCIITEELLYNLDLYSFLNFIFT